MKTTILVSLVTVLIFGCGKPGTDEQTFEKVEIQRILPQNAKATVTVTDRATVAKLVAYFPNMGQGKKSNIAAGWKSAYVLTFTPTKGEPVKVKVDSKGEAWTEGPGDWQAKPGLKEYLDGLVAKSESKEADTGWSKPVNGLQGRLVRLPGRKVIDTEIIDINVEVMNVSTDPMAVSNDPAAVRLKLLGPDEMPVPQGGMTRSGPVPSPQWGLLPRDSYLGFSLYDYGVGVPQGQGTLLSILEGNAWLLKPGKYTLRGTYIVTKEKAPQKNAWTGELDLPSIGIDVR